MEDSLFLCLLKRLLVFAGLPLVLIAQSATASVSTPKYVQSNYAAPQTPDSTVTVPYTAAQTEGNLNVVVVGWNDSTATVTSLTDSMGNAYQLAVGPMVTGVLSQAIYYAKNISAAKAAANAVTVTFNIEAIYPDIRVMEYSGIDPANAVDTAAGAVGNGTMSSSPVTTTNATDLLVAANTVQSLTSVAGSGFTLRLLTEPDGDIIEDWIVSATGTYTGSAPLTHAGSWVMQVVAFRAAGSASPTPTPSPTPPALSYVQGNYAVPQTPQTSVTVPYPAAQIAGDLNVVIVGWNDSTTDISELTDSSGNIYQLAIGPTMRAGALSQAIFYAENIEAAKAGTNAVTVTFNGAANYPDIRILEYRGIDAVNPVDGVAGAAGSGGTSSSGTVATTNDEDLLIGANTVQTSTTGPGSTFTQRLLTQPDGDIVEDQLVTDADSYSASAPLTNAGNWVMQAVAFRVANSTPAPTPSPTPKPTPTPTPKPTPTPTPKPSPTPSPLLGSSVTLAWNADPPTSDPATNPVGYRLHTGIISGVYTQSSTLGNTTTVTVSNLVSGITYYYTVTAYNYAGLDGPPSNEVSFTAP